MDPQLLAQLMHQPTQKITTDTIEYLQSFVSECQSGNVQDFIIVYTKNDGTVNVSTTPADNIAMQIGMLEITKNLLFNGSDDGR